MLQSDKEINVLHNDMFGTCSRSNIFTFILFLKKQHFSSGDQPSTSSVSNMQEGKNQVLPSFWIPSMTPAAEATKMEKPVTSILNFSQVKFISDLPQKYMQNKGLQVRA